MKNLLVTLTTTALVMGCLSSCNEYLPDIAGTSVDAEKTEALQQKLDEFTKNFETRFGNIDPTHDWGFGDIKGLPENGTRAQVANKNEWTDKYHMQVPGWPDTWYSANDNEVHYGDGNGNRYHNSDGYSATQGNVPGGDVTDEEIQYVSWWFRTHRYPSSLNVHWSDFYIQEVSADNDRDANGNKVIEVAEYVKTEDGSWKRSRTEEISSMTIDQLKVKTMESTHGDLDSYDHIYNFNSGASNTLFDIPTLSMATNEKDYNWGDETAMSGKTSKRMIAYYQTSGTEDWTAHYSNDEVWRSNYLDRNIWVMVHLHFVGKSGRIYDGYYLGFDYAFHKTFDENKYQIRKPDGYYSNWILKVSPGVPLPPSQSGDFSRRIMCEDLGNTWDLDFDDVVFDATINLTQEELNQYTSSKSAADVDVTITLMAAGGTMPIYVGKNAKDNASEKKYEAHKLFIGDMNGKEVEVPINVANGTDAAIVNYHTTINSVNFDDIPIYIYNNRINQWVELPKSVHNAKYDVNHGSYMTSDKSRAPQKFAVPTSVLWLKETKQIESAYPKFKDWVNAENGEYKNDSENSWYLVKNQDKKENLCGMAAETPFDKSPTPGQITDNGLVGTTSSYVAFKHYDVMVLSNNRQWGTVKVQYGGKSASSATTDGFITVPCGSEVSLVATPETDCWFVKWDDNTQNNDIDNKNVDSSTGIATAKIPAVNGMRYVMGYFQKPYKVTVKDDFGTNARIASYHVNEGGKAVPDKNLYYKCKIRFECNMQEKVAAGYTFVGWFLNGVLQEGQNNNIEIDITQDSEVYPVFVPNGEKYTFTIKQPTGGSITYSGANSQDYVIVGSQITMPYTWGLQVTATPDSGYRFVSWNNGWTNNSGYLKAYPGCLPNNELTCTFEKIYSAQITAGTGGSIAFSPTKNYQGYDISDYSQMTEFKEGTEISLTATPSDGYHFKQWSDGNVEASRIFKITGYQMTLSAEFEQDN